jgi:hypothetical protein
MAWNLNLAYMMWIAIYGLATTADGEPATPAGDVPVSVNGTNRVLPLYEGLLLYWVVTLYVMLLL